MGQCINKSADTQLDRRKVLGVSLGSAIALMSTTEVYAACINVGSSVTVVGSTGCVNWSGGNMTLTSNGTLSSSSAAALTASALAETLTNSGLLYGTSFAALENTSNSLAVVNNTAMLSDTVGILNNSTILSLTNNAGGTISGNTAGIQNNTYIMSLSNGGIMTGGVGVSNTGDIGTLSNTGSITGTTVGLQNNGTITSLNNTTGTISGTTAGIQNNTAITSLINNSVITGGVGIGNAGNIGTLSNTGSITGTTAGIQNSGTTSSLINNSAITAADAISNTGTLGTLVNNGSISGSGYAIYNTSTGIIGPVTNNGLIAGDISNLSSTGLTINGASGANQGTLTGASGNIDSASMGTIVNNAADLYFNSGNLLLNDNVNVGTFTLQNTGQTLQVNNPVSITGNYAQSSATTLLLGVGDSAVSNGATTDTGYGRLIVSGTATIGSGSTVSLKSLNAWRFASGQRYVVVSAAKSGTNFNASTLNYVITAYDGETTGSVVDTGNTSNLVVSLGNQTPTTPQTPGGGDNPSTPGNTSNGFATTANALSSLRGLQNYTGIAPGLLDLYNASLAIDSTQEANRVGEQLSPVQNSGASHAASMATFGAVNVVSQRVDSIRLAQSHGMSGVAAGDSPDDWSAWGQVFGGHVNQGMVDNVSGYKANYGGLVLGGDRLVGEAWRMGGALTYSYTSVRNQDNLYGNKTGVDSWGVIGYASYTGDPWYVNLSASVTQQRYDTTRNVSMTGYSDRASGKFNGQQYVTNAEFGYPLLVADNTTLTPLASLNYSYQTTGSYKESSDNGSALSVGGSHNNAVRSGLGARLDKSFQTGFGDVVPFIQAVWTHQYNPQRSSTTASYIAATAGETNFTTFGASPVEDTADLSVGATLVKSDTLTLNARYNVQLGQQYQGQTVILQVRKQF